MKNKQSAFRLSLLVALTLVASNAFGQQAFVPCGRIITGLGGSFSFSTGQIAVQRATDEAGQIRLSEGVVQSLMVQHEVIEGVEPLGVAVGVSPNPTAGLLRVQIEGEVKGQVRYELMDINGRRLQAGVLDPAQPQLGLEAQPAGVYLLLLSDEGGRQSRFRIVKS